MLMVHYRMLISSCWLWLPMRFIFQFSGRLVSDWLTVVPISVQTFVHITLQLNTETIWKYFVLLNFFLIYICVCVYIYFLLGQRKGLFHILLVNISRTNPWFCLDSFPGHIMWGFCSSVPDLINLLAQIYL